MVATEHLNPAGSKYQQAQERMTNEVIGACEAVKDRDMNYPALVASLLQ